jgi:hypothetical protein
MLLLMMSRFCYWDDYDDDDCFDDSWHAAARYNDNDCFYVKIIRFFDDDDHYGDNQKYVDCVSV